MDWIVHYSPIFFDLDGLLIDTEAFHYKAFRQVVENRGLPFPWDFATYASILHKNVSGIREFLVDALPELRHISWSAFYREKREAYLSLVRRESLEMMPGAEEMLSYVQRRNVPYAVVTNSIREYVEIAQMHLPLLKQIPHWITREDYANPKPAPDAYYRAMEILGGSGERALGFEDTMRGISALERARITPVLINPLGCPQSEVRKAPLLSFTSFWTLLTSLKK